MYTFQFFNFIDRLVFQKLLKENLVIEINYEYIKNKLNINSNFRSSTILRGIGKRHMYTKFPKEKVKEGIVLVAITLGIAGFVGIAKITYDFKRDRA